MSKYKVGDKVVYEVKEIIRDGVYLLSGWKESEPLTAYTEPLEAKIRRQAAEITRLLAENKELKEDFKKSKRVNLNMGRLAGQNEAWELVRKIFDMEINDIEDIFIETGAWNLGTVLDNFTYQEAAAKVAEWEKIKEIKVGDILEDRDEGNKVIVTSLKGRVICLLWDDGRIGTTYVELAKGIFRNTGRHIDVDSFLKQIGGGDDEK